METVALPDRKAEANLAYGKAARLMQGGKEHRDPTQAACFLHEAAALGHARAQYNLALMYLKGVGVAKSLEESLHWLEQAARNHEPHALALLGLFDPQLALALGAPKELIPVNEVAPLPRPNHPNPTAALPAQKRWRRMQWMFRSTAARPSAARSPESASHHTTADRR